MHALAFGDDASKATETASIAFPNGRHSSRTTQIKLIANY
jgi:hypothetical protein